MKAWCALFLLGTLLEHASALPQNDKTNGSAYDFVRSILMVKPLLVLF